MRARVASHPGRQTERMPESPARLSDPRRPDPSLPAMIYRPGGAASRGGCGTCEHFHGEWVARGAHAMCRRGARPLVHAQPTRGCAFHLRAPGAEG